MAEILGILGAIYTSALILGDFASYTTKWRHLSDRLFDIKEGLDAAELSFKSWQAKYEVRDGRPVIYMHVLFGRLGWERIQQTLGSIKIVAKTIYSDIEKVVSRTLLAGPQRRGKFEQYDHRHDKELVQECLHRIKRNMKWSRKFQLSVLGKAEDLEMRLDRLHRKLNMLERFSDHYLELEHPDIFHTIKRLPGRKVILKVGDGRGTDAAHHKLDALSARKDAELLHKASGPGNRLHIGLSVPQIHRRDFAFLLSLNGQTHEVLLHPVKIKAINDRSRLPSELTTAVPTLLRTPRDPCYILPSTSLSDGFQLSLPPSNILADLEHRDPLSTLLTKTQNPFQTQVLHPQDQVALSASLATSAFRLIGSQWLAFLDCNNVRWRRGKELRWTSMLAAVPGNSSITRSLDAMALSFLSNRRNSQDISKHIHIFRIGLVLAELALRTPISYIDFDSTRGAVRIFMNGLNGDGDEVRAAEIAAEVDVRTNVLLGNMVFFCLSVLQEKEVLRDGEVEARFAGEVLRDAGVLEGLVGGRRRR